jgi:hypothetical protein
MGNLFGIRQATSHYRITVEPFQGRWNGQISA